MGNVVSVNISAKKGELKHPVSEISLKLRHGIVGDAHAGDWHRQISLLAEESINTMRAACSVELSAGIFAENINTIGIDLKNLPIGTHLRVGKAEIEVASFVLMQICTRAKSKKAKLNLQPVATASFA